MSAVCQTVVPFIPFVPTSAPFLLYRARRLHWRNTGAAASVRHTESSNVKRQRFRRPVGAVHKRALVGSVSGSYCKAALQNNSRTRTRVRRPTHTHTHPQTPHKVQHRDALRGSNRPTWSPSSGDGDYASRGTTELTS